MQELSLELRLRFPGTILDLELHEKMEDPSTRSVHVQTSLKGV